MKVSGMQVATVAENLKAPDNNDALEIAYRTSFQEYSRKLDVLQRLIGAGSIDTSQIEAALLDVEKARMAHSCARDQLARELERSSFPPSHSHERRVNEHQIRETAQLLWELGGRPAGTAERDWRRAEQLVHSAASSGCC
jgi:hypothetical protein